MESSLKNMILTLLIITAVGSAAVGGVYLLTKQIIEQSQVAKVNNAIKEVMPPFDNDPSAEARQVGMDGQMVNIYPARSGDELLGYAVETFSRNGFGGEIRLMVGILSDGTINGVSVISQNETPGLGDKILRSKSDFSLQFEGQHPSNFKLAVKKDGGDVDAITASTISSRAFTEAVHRAYELFMTFEK